MTKSFCKKCLFILSVLSIFNTNQAKAEIPTSQSGENIDIYQFYYAPFGYRCSLTKKYLNKIIKSNFPHAKFHLVNVDKVNSEEFIPNYKTKQKGAVILNSKTDKFKISKVRVMISEGFTEKQIEKQIIKEVNSIL